MAKQEARRSNKLHLTITTPRGVKFVERADMVIMRCIDGDLGVLPGHAPISAVLGDGILRYINNGVEKKLAIFGGVAEINDKTVRILSTIAQRPDEIDLERAERDRREAEATLLDESDEHKVKGMQIMLHRSLVRIEVSRHLSEPDYIDDVDDDDGEDA